MSIIALYVYIKYCDEQKQICILKSRIEHNILHNDIDEEVKKLVDEDIENNIIQKSLLDAIRNFNMRIENAMNGKSYFLRTQTI